MLLSKLLIEDCGFLYSYIMIEVKKKGGRVRDNPIISFHGNVTVAI